MAPGEPAAKRQREAAPAESVAEQPSIQGGRPPPQPTSRTVRLPGREVNPQRARLWQELGTNSLLFDVTLRAADREVPCNRFILAEESPFFEAKFRSPEFAQADGSIDLTELDGATLQAVVGSLFTAHLEVAPDTMRQLLHAADLLQLPVVKAACARLIQENLNEETLPGSLEIADKYSLGELRDAVLAYVKSTFFLMHRTSLRGLGKGMLLELLSADDLTVFSEMQVFRSVLAWCDEHDAAADLPAMFTATVRMQHLETFECRSLLAHPLVSGSAAATAIVEALLNRLEGGTPLSGLPRRDGRRFVWAIDPWSQQSRQPTVRSRDFGLAGSERTWALSCTREKLGFHLTCLGGDEDNEDHVPYSPMSQEAAQEEVQLTMVLYDQADYNRARRWRLPRRTIMPGEYQGFDEFFKDVDDWVRDDRLVVGVQLRLVSRPESPLDEDDAASAHEPHTGGFVGDLHRLTTDNLAAHNHASS